MVENPSEVKEPFPKPLVLLDGSLEDGLTVKLEGGQNKPGVQEGPGVVPWPYSQPHLFEHPASCVADLK